MKKYVFLDFNGTIIDDVELCLELLNQILIHQHKKTLTKEEYQSVFTFPVRKYYELAGIDFKLNSFEELADWFIKQYQPLSLKCGLYPDAVSTFQILKKKGYHLVILSASEQHNLLEQCESYGIVGYFDAILGIDNIHAAGKVGIALDYMRQHQIRGEDIVFVGDTLHDLEVAKAMQSRVFLVSCGHQSVEVLKQGGVPIIGSISDLIEQLEDVADEAVDKRAV